MRNPKWTREELILALDLYVKVGRKQVEAEHPSVIELSGLLRELGIHKESTQGPNFRNANSVSMKLGNFMSVDPRQKGNGLSRGNRLEKVVWNEFANDGRSLADARRAILSTIKRKGGGLETQAL